MCWKCFEQKKALGKAQIERVAFNAVTKAAVLEAIAHPRAINEELVDAYLARRALDYLVGFTLSPVLWRKLPGRALGGARAIGGAAPGRASAKSRSKRSGPRNIWTIDAELRATVGRVPGAPHPSRRQEARKTFAGQRSRRQARGRGDRGRTASPSAASSPSRSSAIPRRPSSPRRCSRKPRASLASPPSARCRSPNSFTRASISAAKPWA